ncbi:MAG: hypothetical protein MZV70_14800 [Desulfobacterales bacterium]|nr:hypothetical protein [Desulfobacterales bacterium]
MALTWHSKVILLNMPTSRSLAFRAEGVKAATAATAGTTSAGDSCGTVDGAAGVIRTGVGRETGGLGAAGARFATRCSALGRISDFVSSLISGFLSCFILLHVGFVSNFGFRSDIEIHFPFGFLTDWPRTVV